MEKTFGDLVFMRRNALEMSMRELAKRVGIDVAYISKIEKGKTLMPSFSIVMRLSSELGITLQTLQNVFGLDGNFDELMMDSLNSEETNFGDKKIVKNLIDDVTNIIENPQLDTEKVGSVFQSILQLHASKHKAKKVFHIITLIEKDWINILKTPFIDSQLLTLYHQVIEVNENYSFIIEGEILQLPKFDEKSLINTLTLQDLFDQCTLINESDYLYEEHLELKEYLEMNFLR